MGLRPGRKPCEQLENAAEAASTGRHRRDRVALPELPTRFGDPGVALKAVEAAWRRPRASGMAVLDAGHLAGYLFADLSVDAFRGRIAWMREAGHALDAALDADDLYR
jgi:hypothetical protein